MLQLKTLFNCDCIIIKVMLCYVHDHILDALQVPACVQRHFQQYFSYIVAVSFFLVQKARVPRENHRPVESHLA